MPPRHAHPMHVHELAVVVLLLVLVLCAHSHAGLSAGSALFPKARRVLSANGHASEAFLVPLSGVPEVKGPHGRGLLRTGALGLNGSSEPTVGYFAAAINLGTPPQLFQLIVDTGSPLVYVPCAECYHCGPNHFNPPFNASRSSTAERVSCNSTACNCPSTSCYCMGDYHCGYHIGYVEGSAVTGSWILDTLGFPVAPTAIVNSSSMPPPVYPLASQAALELPPQLAPPATFPPPPQPPSPPVRLMFGCADSEAGLIYSQQPDGVMGMNKASTSFHTQLASQGVVADVFYLCLGYPEDGFMLLGEVQLNSPEPMSFTPAVSAGFQWNLNVTGMTVDGVPLNVSPVYFDASVSKWMLDSGTTYNYFPSDIYQAVLQRLDAAAAAGNITRTAGYYHPSFTCWAGFPTDRTQLSSVFPTLELSLANSTTLSLHPLQYLFENNAPDSYCLAIFQMASPFILGGISIRDLLVKFDVANNQAGILPMDSCADIQDMVVPAAGATSPPPRPPRPPSPRPAVRRGPPPPAPPPAPGTYPASTSRDLPSTGPSGPASPGLLPSQQFPTPSQQLPPPSKLPAPVLQLPEPSGQLPAPSQQLPASAPPPPAPSPAQVKSSGRLSRPCHTLVSALLAAVVLLTAQQA